jgi:hypothetical protein
VVLSIEDGAGRPGGGELARAREFADHAAMALRAAIALLSLGTALTACGDDGGDPVVRLAQVQAEVFDVGCTVQSCHSSTARAGDLVLEAGKARAELVDVPAAQARAAAEGLLRVAPSDPEASFLLMKCTAPLAADYGEVMPWGNPDGLAAEELELLRRWIEAGAPE